MKKLSTSVVTLSGALVIAGCSVFGDSGVEIAPFDVLVSDGALEIRHYDKLILISAPMDSDEHKASSAFRKLFGYISGDNSRSQEIAMTAPVLIDRPSTDQRMYFVLPSDFSLDSAPSPSDSSVGLSRIAETKYAVITFNGLLRHDNINEHKEKLVRWLEGRTDFEASGPYISAGYNPPWTLPMMRRNEVLIPVTRR